MPSSFEIDMLDYKEQHGILVALMFFDKKKILSDYAVTEDLILQ